MAKPPDEKQQKLNCIVTPQSGNSQRDWSKTCHVL